MSAPHTPTGSPTATWSAPSAGSFDNPPDAVAHPADEAELERVLAWCEEANAAAIPFGGGTSVVGGVEPPGDRPAVSIDLKRLDRVLEVDRVSRAARIQAGATGPALEDQLRGHGLTLRHFPQSFEFSTLGGWIATRAGGHYATLHTHIDDFVESVRALTPRGWWESRRLPASGAGPSPGPSADRLGGHPRRDHRGVDARAGRAALQGIGGGPVRLVRIRRAGRARPVAIRAPPVELPAARPGRGSAHRGGARPPGAARSRLRVRRPRAGPLDGPRARALRRPRRAAAGARRRAGRRTRGRDTERGASEGAWRDAFLQAPYLRDTLVAAGVLAETFETAITWDRFADLVDTRPRGRARRARRRGGGDLPAHSRVSGRRRALLHGAGAGPARAGARAVERAEAGGVRGDHRSGRDDHAPSRRRPRPQALVRPPATRAVRRGPARGEVGGRSRPAS